MRLFFCVRGRSEIFVCCGAFIFFGVGSNGVDEGGDKMLLIAVGLGFVRLPVFCATSA